MKKYLHIFIFFAFCLSMQNGLLAQNTCRVPINALGLIRTNAALTPNVTIGDERSKAITALGNPDELIIKYLESIDKNAEIMLYGNNKLYFVDNRLFGYDLNEPGISLGADAIPPIQIGSEAPLVWGFPYILNSMCYPVSMISGMSRNIPYSGVMVSYFSFITGFVGQQPVDVDHDGRLEILFNSNRRVISIFASY